MKLSYFRLNNGNNCFSINEATFLYNILFTNFYLVRIILECEDNGKVYEYGKFVFKRTELR